MTPLGNLLFTGCCFMTSFACPGQDSPELDRAITKKVERIAKSSSMRRAFEFIDVMEPRTTKDLIYLTEIAAPPFKEEIRANAFLELLKEAGIENVTIDEAGNVIAVRKGTSGSGVVVLDAHLDTVFPEETDLTVQFRGDTLAAPGIGDDTRGLAMVVSIVRAIIAEEIQTSSDIWFVGSVGEEGLGDLKGVKYLFRPGATKIDAWIAIDGGSIGRVTHSGIGSHRYRVTFKGPGGHSWGAFGLANPHHALGLAIESFVNDADAYTSEGPKTSYNIGRIGGGTSINSIPFESWMEVDMRSVSPDRLNELDEIFQKAMDSALEQANAMRREGEPLVLEVTLIGDRPSGSIPVTTPLVQRAAAATLFFGVEPHYGTGSTNSNIPISMGIPAVTIGRGGQGGGAHSLHEWWLNDNGADGIKLALLLLVSEAGLSK